ICCAGVGAVAGQFQESGRDRRGGRTVLLLRGRLAVPVGNLSWQTDHLSLSPKARTPTRWQRVPNEATVARTVDEPFASWLKRSHPSVQRDHPYVRRLVGSTLPASEQRPGAAGID